MKISAVIMAYNEEQEIPELAENLKGLDEMILLDGGSTDKTVEIAKEKGFKIFTREQWQPIHPTNEDIEKFTKLFGFAPTFTIESKIINEAGMRNWGASLAENDWIYFPDCDERVTWDLPKIRELTDICDVIYYTFVHAHDSKGKSTCEFTHSKLYNRTKSQWEHRIHGVIMHKDIKTARTDAMKVDHWQKPKASRNENVVTMEYSMTENPANSRIAYYLGREYMYMKEWAKAVKMLEHYLSLPDGWNMDVAQAHIFKGICLKLLRRDKESLEAYFQSILINPKRREPYYEIGKYFYEKEVYGNAVIW